MLETGEKFKCRFEKFAEFMGTEQILGVLGYWGTI